MCVQGSNSGSGAGYGSAGGYTTGMTAGGPVYGMTRQVVDAGSGGGSSAVGVGGRGGGLLNITNNRALHVDGKPLYI